MRPQLCAIAFLFFSTFTKVSAQTFADCNVQGPMFVKVEEAPIFKGSLQEYFEKELAGMFTDFIGTIHLQILIDTTGKACCMRVSNNSSAISSVEIKDAVNRMTGWSPAKQNNYLVYFAAMLQITFDKSKLSVTYANEKQPVPKPPVNP